MFYLFLQRTENSLGKSVKYLLFDYIAVNTNIVYCQENLYFCFWIHKTMPFSDICTMSLFFSSWFPSYFLIDSIFVLSGDDPFEKLEAVLFSPCLEHWHFKSAVTKSWNPRCMQQYNIGFWAQFECPNNRANGYKDNMVAFVCGSNLKFKLVVIIK